jgi:LPXTG-site transpeptidase (sortase) family protein
VPVPTAPEQHAEHGGRPTWWVAVLGFVVLAGAGLVVAGVLLLTDAGPAAVHATSARSAVAPYVVEPEVRIRAVAAAEPTHPARSPGAGRPESLVVPRLGVDAPVYPIGAPGGVLTPPSNPRTLGWWKDGAVPGAAHGGALITGHTVHTGGGAFDDLETLEAGDDVRVRTDRGVIRYAVSGVTIYPKASLARDAARIFRQTGPGRLVLITCEDWNGSIYLSNAVVFADPVA